MITTLAGANEFLLKQALAAMRADFVITYGDLALDDIDAEELEDPSRLLAAVQSVAFLSPKKMVIIRKLSAHKAAADTLESLLAAAGDDTELVFYEPLIDKRTATYKLLKARTDLKEYAPLDERGLAKWLVEYVSQQNGKLTYADAMYLVERIGSDQQLVYQEVTKLLLYKPEIDRAAIDLLTDATPQSKIFELLDAAFSGQLEKTLRLYDEQRAQKVEPQQILAMLAWQLHLIALLKNAGPRSSGQVAAQTGLKPFVIDKTARLAKSLTLQKIRMLVAQALDIDVKSKTKTYDLDEALKTFLVTIKS